MATEKIYIQLLDGATAYIPVNAIRLSNSQFQILDDKEFKDYVDTLYVHEFYPGDIVELGPHKFHDGSTGEVALKLIKSGQWPDRKLNEFKFKATLGQLTIDRLTANNYRNEIEKIKISIAKGQIFYQDILDAINSLDNLIN